MFRSVWLCCLTLVLVPCCFRYGYSSCSFRCSVRYVTGAERCPALQKILPMVTEHISPWREKVKNAWSFDFITILQHWWHLSLFENYRNVFSAVVPPSGAEGGSQVMWNTENFLMFVFSRLGAGQGNTSPWLWSNVMSPWSIRYPTKVSFKNTFSFVAFTSIVHDPLRKVKSRFHGVNLLASSLDQWWTKS